MVVIIGVCCGIGVGIVECFVCDGVNLVMVFNVECVYEIVEILCQCYQVDILLLQVDVIDEVQVQGLYEQVVVCFGIIDVFIQNVGVIIIDYYDWMLKVDFEKVLVVNIIGVWLCCCEVVKYMVKQNYGSLINIFFGQG